MTYLVQQLDAARHALRVAYYHFDAAQGAHESVIAEHVKRVASKRRAVAKIESQINRLGV